MVLVLFGNPGSCQNQRGRRGWGGDRWRGGGGGGGEGIGGGEGKKGAERIERMMSGSEGLRGELFWVYVERQRGRVV